MPFKIFATLLWAQRRLFIWFVFLAFMLLVWCVVNRRVILEYRQAYNHHSDLQEEVDRLRQEKRELEQVVQRLDAGGTEVELAARKMFLLRRPGEKVATVTIAQPGDALTSPTFRRQ